MRLDLYQAETARVASEQQAVLVQAREIMAQRKLNLLEQAGVLHALQVLIELPSARRNNSSKPETSRCQFPLMMPLLLWRVSV
jgi:hypothetical protein